MDNLKHASRTTAYWVIPHPMIGWYISILLAAIAAIPALNFFVSPLAAHLLSLIVSIGTGSGYGLCALAQRRRSHG